jgi:hypothetical protein
MVRLQSFEVLCGSLKSLQRRCSIPAKNSGQSQHFAVSLQKSRLRMSQYRRPNPIQVEAVPANNPLPRKRLASLPDHMPRTNVGKVRWLWPHIQKAEQAGRKLTEIWEAAREDGIEMTYKQFALCVWRVRRKLQPVAAAAAPTPPAEATPLATGDPFQNIRAQREKNTRRAFDFDPFSIDKDYLK